jgi:hypothetical protein
MFVLIVAKRGGAAAFRAAASDEERSQDGESDERWSSKICTTQIL